MELTTGPLPASDRVTKIPYNLCLRTSTGGGYGSNYTIQLTFNPKAQTATVAFTGGNRGGTSSPKETGAPFPVQTGHAYILTATARSLHPGGGTLLACTVADTTAPSVILASGRSHLIPYSRAWLSQPKPIALQQERSDLTDSDLTVITRLHAFARPVGPLTTIAAPLAANASGHIVTISGKNTQWTLGGPANPNFTVSNLPGVSITAQEILSPTLARLTLTTADTTGFAILTDSSNGGSCEIEITSAPALLAVTQLMPQPAAGAVKILGGIVTGGTPPYSFQWHRSTTWSFVPSDATMLPGATRLDLSDTPPDAQCYAYKLVVTDHKGAVASSHSAPGQKNWHPATALLVPPASLPPVPLKIGWIGDSITASSTNVKKTITLLAAAGVPVASSTNRGVSGSATTKTKSGWHPDVEGGYYAKALESFKTDGVNILMLMLGTNDAQAYNVPKDAYIANLDALLTRLAADLPGVPVILNTPSLASRIINTDPNNTQIAFVDATDQLVARHPNALRGDRDMTVWSYLHYDEYADDIHPNEQGTDSQSRYWAAAILRNLSSLSLPSTTL